jgi:hypothetical protein
MEEEIFSPLKLSYQMKKNLVGSTYGKFCIRFPQNRMKGEQQSVANSIRKLKFEKAINDKEMLM